MQLGDCHQPLDLLRLKFKLLSVNSNVYCIVIGSLVLQALNCWEADDLFVLTVSVEFFAFVCGAKSGGTSLVATLSVCRVLREKSALIENHL